MLAAMNQPIGELTDRMRSIFGLVVEAYLERGGNMIDTANIYGRGAAETFLGDALKGKERSSYVLATKLFFPMTETDRGLSREQIHKQLDFSLERLQTDYVDLYQCHRPDPETPIEETMRALDDLVHQGDVRYIGCSNFKAWQTMKALGLSDCKGWPRFIAAQYQYSLVVRDIEAEFTDLCLSEGVGLVPWGPLGGGFLSGKYRRGKPPTRMRSRCDMKKL